MQTKRKRRFYFIVILLFGISSAVSLALIALRQNINLYYTPQQILNTHIPRGQIIRIGGMVIKNSIRHVPNSLRVNFMITDFHARVAIHYNGILPSLFKEGRGVIVQGHFNTDGIFIADQVLAKHDATYHPPQLARHLKRIETQPIRVRGSMSTIG